MNIFNYFLRGVMHKTQNQGVTLIELSVVLVIIALLVGGVMAGQSLIENSKLQAIATERARYVSATKQFQDQYYSLPGDFKQAEALWGTASGGCTNGARSGSQTCNGNGSGFIEANAEMFHVWEHLGNAQLIDEKYVAIRDGSLTPEPGINEPASQFSDRASWRMYTLGSVVSDSLLYDGNYGTMMLLISGTMLGTDYHVMSPSVMVKVDLKFDDGDPTTGKIRPTKLTDCVVGSAYNTSDNESRCALVWLTGF